jgi:DNA-binding transcriptional LysR family regulator
METPTLRQLRTFIAAVDLGSVTEAARSLNLTQPAASQQLREMERILGARLLDRAEGRVVPTAAGNAILAPARRAQAAAAEVVTAALACRSGDFGRVRLGTGATACIHLLPPVLEAARRRMPGLEILVVIGNTPEMLRRVEDGSLDAGLVTMPRSISRALVQIRLRRDEMVALVPRGTMGEGALSPAELAGMPLILYEAGGDTRGVVDAWFRKAGLVPRGTMGEGALSPAELAGMPLILYEAGGDTRGVVDAWFRKAGLAPKPIMELGSVEAIKVLVGSGLGASVLPRLALPGEVPGTELRALRPGTERELVLVMRKEKVLDRGLRVMTEALQAA